MEILKTLHKAGGTALLRTHKSLLEDLDSVSSTSIRRLITSCNNSSSSESDILFWSPWTPKCTQKHTYIKIDMQKNTIKNTTLKKTEEKTSHVYEIVKSIL